MAAVLILAMRHDPILACLRPPRGARGPSVRSLRRRSARRASGTWTRSPGRWRAASAGRSRPIASSPSPRRTGRPSSPLSWPSAAPASERRSSMRARPHRSWTRAAAAIGAPALLTCPTGWPLSRRGARRWPPWSRPATPREIPGCAGRQGDLRLDGRAARRRRLGREPVRRRGGALHVDGAARRRADPGLDPDGALVRPLERGVAGHPAGIAADPAGRREPARAARRRARRRGHVLPHRARLPAGPRPPAPTGGLARFRAPRGLGGRRALAGDRRRVPRSLRTAGALLLRRQRVRRHLLRPRGRGRRARHASARRSMASSVALEPEPRRRETGARWSCARPPWSPAICPRRPPASRAATSAPATARPGPAASCGCSDASTA